MVEDNENEKHEMETENRNNPLFRQAVVEKQANPSQLDTMLQIVSPHSWASLVAIALLLVTVLLWSLLGTVPIKVEGRGIVISSKGLFSIQSKVKGVVMQVYANSGEFVQAGTLIAELADQEKSLQKEDARIKLEKLEHDYTNLKEAVEKEGAAVRLASQKDLAAKKFTVEQLKSEIAKIEIDIEKRKKLLEEGLISKSVLESSEEKYYSKKIELETTEATIANIQANMIKGYRTEELKTKEQDLNKARDEYELLASTVNEMKIYSPVTGRVLDWLVNKGDLVNPGTPLVWMELTQEDLETPKIVLGYLPIEKGKKVAVGDRVEIEVSTVNVQEFGFITGRVHQISQYAVSKQNIANVIKNDGLANYLTAGNEVVIQVLITPDLDPNTISGFKWSSGDGPPIKITTGTICSLRTIVERVRPFYYVLPVWKIKAIEDSVSKPTETSAETR